jgi:Na+/glutamate symporter
LSKHLSKFIFLEKEPHKDQSWVKYLSLGGQIFASIAIMLALGWKLDQWLGFTTSVLIWVLPLLMIVSILVKLIIDTNRK